MTGAGSPCGACKFLRRKCARGCVFAPYFCHEQGAAHFAAIHKVFGASNVSKLLANLPVGERCEAAVTISYEAQARLRDPIYGCVSHIFALQQQVFTLQAQLACLREQASQSPELQSWLKQEYSSSTSYLPQFNPHQIDNNAAAFSGYENASMGSSAAGNSQAYPVMFQGENNGSFPSIDEDAACISALDNMQTGGYRWSFRDADDLQSVAFGHHAQHS
ncbi:hypothetical protein MLD38_039316 [Melastoma candidum]|uniref:Uncharacterized protein n=1 Tax=Melastoma candidum TaxID=119954 RepID=A0ACB9L424_9MYRT|nr:hypothetical protein MLD38_039316 [Melastoma candidum]